jgi:PST family polysaccharide transporter
LETGFLLSFIQRERLSHELASTFFWFMLALALLAATIGCAAALPAGAIFDQPEVPAIIVALSCCLPISALGSTHAALLRRQMQQGALIVSSALGSVVAAAAGVIAAMNGYGWWALVAQSAAGAVTRSVAHWYFCSWRPGRPVRSVGVRGIVGRGAVWTSSELVGLARRSIDQPLIGWWWGADVLGTYSRGVVLSSIFYVNGVVPISSAVAPALMRLQSQPERLRAACLQVADVLTFWASPLLVFPMIAAEPLVRVMLGPSWADSVPVVRATVLGLYFFSTIGIVANLYSSATGNARAMMRAAGLALPLGALGCIAAVPFGPAVMAAVLAVIAAIANLNALAQAVSGSDLGVRTVLRRMSAPLWRALVAAVPPAVLIGEFGGSAHPLLELMASGLLFAVLYLSLWCVSARGRDHLRGMVEVALGRKAGRAGAVIWSKVRRWRVVSRTTADG